MNRRVVALGATRREDDLHRMGTDQLSNLSPGGFDYRLQLGSEFVGAGRIPPFRDEVRHHGLQHLWQDGGGGIVVEVDRFWKLPASKWRFFLRLAPLFCLPNSRAFCGGLLSRLSGLPLLFSGR